MHAKAKDPPHLGLINAMQVLQVAEEFIAFGVLGKILAIVLIVSNN